MTVSDSAGVEVVTHLPGSVDSAASWSLAPDPVAEIGGGADPDPALFGVTDVAPLGGGRVAVGMTRPPRVLVIDADGAATATFGGPGDGPGEFRSVGSLVALAGDSVAVWDPDRRRMSVYTVDGGFEREVDLSGHAPPSVTAAPDSETLAGWTRLLPSADGSFVLFTVAAFGPDERPRPGVGRVEAPSRRIGPGGEELARYGPFPGTETFMSTDMGVLPYPFGADTYGATADGHLVVGTAETPELRVYGPEGALERIVRWPDRDRAVQGPVLERWNEFRDARLSARSEGERTMLAGVLDAIPRPERLPAYADLVSSDSGEIWVGGYPGQLELEGIFEERLRVPQRQWRVLALDGDLLATVDTPAGFQPLIVTADRVWGVHTDDLGVESVRAYAIQRR